jgi:nucleotide-binding universal stress UspA family protein
LEAIDIAKAMGAKLTAVYVVPGGDVRPNAVGSDISKVEKASIDQKAAEEVVSFVEAGAKLAGVDLEVKILNGNPGNEIVKISKNYDLLVCGSLGRTGIAKMLMGSVSSTIVKYSDCPVLISRSKA